MWLKIFIVTFHKYNAKIDEKNSIIIQLSINMSARIPIVASRAASRYMPQQPLRRFTQSNQTEALQKKSNGTSLFIQRCYDVIILVSSGVAIYYSGVTAGINSTRKIYEK